MRWAIRPWPAALVKQYLPCPIRRTHCLYPSISSMVKDRIFRGPATRASSRVQIDGKQAKANSERIHKNGEISWFTYYLNRSNSGCTGIGRLYGLKTGTWTHGIGSDGTCSSTFDTMKTR
jgi:hypothetical protein